jgi:hypothetical protein
MQDFTTFYNPNDAWEELRWNLGPQGIGSDAPVQFGPYPTVIARRRVAVRVQRLLPAETNPSPPQGGFLSWNSRSQENRELFKIAHLSESPTGHSPGLHYP